LFDVILIFSIEFLSFVVWMEQKKKTKKKKRKEKEKKNIVKLYVCVCIFFLCMLLNKKMNLIF